MKRALLFLSVLISVNAFALPGINEALKNPSAVTVLKLCGEKNEAALLTKNAKKFSALTFIVISGISDSITVEQDIMAVAACSNVHQLNFENCGIKHFSGAMKMLVSVNEIGISNCKNLSSDDAFVVLAEMPSLKKLNYETDKLSELPNAFFRLRGLEKISIHNNDLSLADGYALNTLSPKSLYATDSLSLGFGASKLTLEYSCYDKSLLKSHISIMRDLLQGAVGVGGEMTLPQRAIAFNRINPLIHPPIENLEVRKNIYTTDAVMGGEIQYPSGTKIFIPTNAFVDANGNEVKGNVTIDYREFRDPVDILVSGIPMVYDSAGEAGEFESAGMFEMNASVNGKEVFLAPGKEVDMQFAVVDTASTYNFYKLDEQKGWQYIEQTGKVETTQAAQTIAVNNFSEAVDIFLDKTSRGWYKREPSIEDTTSFERVYADTNYFYTDKRAQHYNSYSHKQVYKEAARLKMVKIPSVKGTSCFKLSSNITDVYHSSNPEINAFNGITWMLNDQLDAATFKQLRSKRSGISDVRITYEGGADFTMELKFPNGFRTFSVTAVKIMGDNHKPEAIAEKRCVQLNRQYVRTLKRRQSTFDKNIKRRVFVHNRWMAKMSADSLNAWKFVNKKMNEKEQGMSYSEWVQHVKLKRKNQFEWTNQTVEASAQQGQIYQALKVMNFGVYNCDQIQRIEKPVEVNAVAYLPDGQQENNASQIYVIDINHNQAFSYQGTPGTSIHIAFGAESKNKMLVVNADGTVSVADEAAFNARTTDETANTRFATTRMSDKPVTTQQLREFIYPNNMARR